tara:strand:- start:158 stop:457 length:300 start_codon:yes stop_codon:yes gene_type:complete
MADNRRHLANLRFAKAALESAKELLKIDENMENRELTAVCHSIGRKAGVLAEMLSVEEDIILRSGEAAEAGTDSGKALVVDLAGTLEPHEPHRRNTEFL